MMLPLAPTVAQCLSVIPVASHYPPYPDALHNPSAVILPMSRRMPPWNPHDILPRAMTTSGGQNYHPSGERDLTLREYACLQGFPLHHVFLAKGIKRQIGNAVPPVCAQVLFQGVRKALESADEVPKPFRS